MSRLLKMGTYQPTRWISITGEIVAECDIKGVPHVTMRVEKVSLSSGAMSMHGFKPEAPAPFLMFPKEEITEHTQVAKAGA